MDSLLMRVKELLSQKGLELLYALLILIVALGASRLAQRYFSLFLDRTRIANDILLRSFFLRLLSALILILGGLMALRSLNFDVQAFIAGLGITGIIIGFGLKDVLSNFAAGLLLLIYRPFRAGESIEVEGTQGVVEELTIVNMQLTTNDGVRVIMPNSKVWGAKIVNYSLSQKRRAEFSLKLNEDYIEEAIKVVTMTFANDARVLKSPAPSIQVASIADGAATLRVWAWSTPGDFPGVAADGYLRLHQALREHDMPLL